MKSYLATSNEDGTILNLAGRYDYLELPYYISQDLELEGKVVYPSCKEMLDAYVTPVLLEKAKKNGIATAEYYISNGYFEPPAIVESINPFMQKSRTIWKLSRKNSAAKSLTRNFKYAICVQEIRPETKIAEFRSVLGWCHSGRYREMSKKFWEVFRIPLAKVRVLVTPDGEILLSNVVQLPYEKLNKAERKFVAGRVSWLE